VLGNVKNVDRTNCIAEMNSSIDILVFSVICSVKIFLYDINVSYINVYNYPVSKMLAECRQTGSRFSQKMSAD